MWLQEFCSLMILQWPWHSWKPFPQKITLKKILSLSHCVCRNDTTSILQFFFFFFDIGVMVSVVLHKRRHFFSPPGCKEKITVFVFLVTRVTCSHPNLLCKSFQSSFLSLGVAFDLFLTSFLCYTTSCLSLLNVLIDVCFQPKIPLCSTAPTSPIAFLTLCPDVRNTVHLHVSLPLLLGCVVLVFLLLLFSCYGFQKQKGCQNWRSLDHPFLGI